MRSIALRAGTGILATVAALTLTAGTARADNDPKAVAPPSLGTMSTMLTVPYVTINANGPIGQIHLGSDLSCQVNIASTLSVQTGPALVGFGGGGQVYGPGHEPADCGTFLSFGGVLYGPDFAAHGYTATPFYGPSYAAFTPVSQTVPTGSGTLTDPYIVTTVVDAGFTGIRLTRIDTYVNGQRNYRSDVVVTNMTGAPREGLRLYHGIDCYLAGSDTGTGVAVTSPATATSRVGCVSGNRTMQLIGVTAGNGYYEDGYNTVWDRINSRLALPNTINPNLVDNGIAVDWAFNLPAYGSVIRTFLTDFVYSPFIVWEPFEPVDRLPVRAALILEQGEPTPRAGVRVDIAVADQESSFTVLVPTS